MGVVDLGISVGAVTEIARIIVVEQIIPALLAIRLYLYRFQVVGDRLDTGLRGIRAIGIAAAAEGLALGVGVALTVLDVPVVGARQRVRI